MNPAPPLNLQPWDRPAGPQLPLPSSPPGPTPPPWVRPSALNCSSLAAARPARVLPGSGSRAPLRDEVSPSVQEISPGRAARQQFGDPEGPDVALANRSGGEGPCAALRRPLPFPPGSLAVFVPSLVGMIDHLKATGRSPPTISLLCADKSVTEQLRLALGHRPASGQCPCTEVLVKQAHPPRPGQISLQAVVSLRGPISSMPGAPGASSTPPGTSSFSSTSLPLLAFHQAVSNTRVARGERWGQAASLGGFVRSRKSPGPTPAQRTPSASETSAQPQYRDSAGTWDEGQATVQSILPVKKAPLIP